jgi:hypothetical protein
MHRSPCPTGLRIAPFTLTIVVWFSRFTCRFRNLDGGGTIGKTVSSECTPTFLGSLWNSCMNYGDNTGKEEESALIRCSENELV